METKPPPWTLAEVAALIGGRLVSGGDFSVRRLVPADSDDPNGLAFVEGESYLRRAEASKVGALLVGDGISSAKPHVQVDSPRRAFRKLTDACRREPRLNPGVHPSAVVDPSAQLHPSARIGPFAVVESGASVGARSRVCAFAYIGDDCRVGEDCLIYPHAVLVQDVRLGDRVIVHAGAVLGADGFGFEWDGTGQRKIAQVGGVVVGNDAEIGALSAVDRATVGDTLLGDGVKLDNLVQIAHNVRIGA
ncbi:MAG: UDP-3-O-(3-hydroxymyristoyl)glucosamine N-acyltransferase, partial [Fimbriimonas ginsengisoli]|nr:UDP-3-O-(3-hydroxymyristoyl)glucosamine N-acyltransferase [Fimbriimonas ginsengisoli]